MIRYLIILLLLVTCCFRVSAQQPVPSVDPREADVMFSKRVWRIIDLRERQNKVICWPRSDVRKVLYQSALNRTLFPYFDETLKKLIDPESFAIRGARKVLVRVLIDPNDPDGLYRTDTVNEPFVPEEQIKQLMLMEDVYYDKKMSREVIRILAVAPLYPMEVEGYALGLQPICWLRYEDRFHKETTIRDLFVKQLVYNEQNYRSTFSFDDWFLQRRFSSFIIKVSNAADLSIMDDPEVKRNGLKALIEAEREKMDQHKLDTERYEE